MKIVINADISGFEIPHETMIRYCGEAKIPVWIEEKQMPWGKLYNYWKFPPHERDTANQTYIDDLMVLDYMLDRTDPHLIAAVEATNPEGLKVVEIPDGTDYMILDYDLGIEIIIDKNHTWGLK